MSNFGAALWFAVVGGAWTLFVGWLGYRTGYYQGRRDLSFVKRLNEAAAFVQAMTGTRQTRGPDHEEG